jgi:hypothetical protein
LSGFVWSESEPRKEDDEGGQMQGCEDLNAMNARLSDDHDAVVRLTQAESDEHCPGVSNGEDRGDQGEDRGDQGEDANG